ncbi:DNA-binding transcriptional LysR family regulator [Bosea sp. OAE752]|jgi:DNA-binding transcriptional LysR family regulator|uniref:LysR family transcriptional regulator n=1 Tax=Bosea spartocytisi TaxID=2773451 RepID=A0A927I202_9HYPH|nr:MULTISPECIES: LysR family transcriptional regulator [Bosea]MBD3847947.1 LysR family transcriptional regulator [Bosea spartocytisi]MCT4470209.1 LysR family transcriptional regulator [Bosea spartocytisi]
MSSKLAWDDFRLVKAITDHGGLTGAAGALAVNHSTVFRRLGQIEEMVGMPLFERRKTGYVATVAGAEMAALAGRMEEDVTAFSRRLAGRDVAPSGEIRITTTDTLHLNLLLPIFAGFRRAHPAIRLDVVIGNQALNLSKRDADVAIRASDTPGETLVGRRIATLAWAIYGRSEDGITAQEKADPARLYLRDWVALGDQLSHVKAARFVREHVAPERIALKSSAVLGITEAVEQGLGIGPLPCFIADRRPGLTRLLPPNPDFATGLWVLTHPDIRHVPRVRAFMDYCSNELMRHRMLIEGAE